MDQAALTEYVGSTDDAIRKANDKRKGFDSLVTLGYVKHEVDEAAGTVHRITAAGRKALAAAAKAEKGAE